MTKKSKNNEFLVMLWLIGGLILLSVPLALSKKSHNNNLNKKEHFAALNTQIEQRWNMIDSLRTGITDRITDSLGRNQEYLYITDNQARIDSLVNANDSLLNQAYSAARKHSMFTIARRNESVFKDFNNLPAVKNASWKYYNNRKQINEFNARKDKIANLAGDVKRDITDKTQTNIATLQHEIDSLLNIKDSMIVQKTR